MILLLEPTRPAGFQSGGYRYQEQVMQRLRAAGTGELLAVEPSRLAAAATSAIGTRGATVVVDGLFGEFGASSPPPGTVALLHAVPSRPAFWRDRDVITTAATTAAVVRAGARSVHVVRPGTDAAFTPAVPLAAPTAATRWRIACIGTVGAGKGQLLVVDALRPFADRCELVLLGDLTSDPQYVAAVRAAAGPLPVDLRGVVGTAEVARELQRSHLLVSASRQESYGMAVAEAVACGVPVFAFAAGEIGSLVRDGDNGRLLTTDAGDADFSTGLAGLLATPNVLTSMQRRPSAPPRSWDEVATEFVAACRACR